MRNVALAATLSAQVLAVTEPAAWAQSTASAASSLAAAKKAAAAKNWTTALTEYQAANKAQPSAEALKGIGDAYFETKQDGEAYAAYEEYKSKYPSKGRSPVDDRLEVLAKRTGLVSVSTSEPGATVSVDDKPAGATPLGAPLRLSAGAHKVRLTKDGFAPFERTVSVVAGGIVSVDGKLDAVSSKGRVSVRERNGRPIRVIVDGIDMGDAPWSGELEAGSHDIVGKGSSYAAAPEKVTVERGATREVELVASSTTGTLKITTSDGRGVIYLDDKLVGEGSFGADIPAGTHTIRVTREGYDSHEETIDLKDKENRTVTVTMAMGSKVETGPIVKEGRRVEGIYGGVGILATFLPGGFQSSMEKLCDSDTRPVELGSCGGGSGVGGGLTGFVGYHWDPIGVELYGGAQYDQASPNLDWNASSVDPGIAADPPRTENFTIRRAGGFLTARVRLSLQTEKFRFSVASGVGIAYRALFLERETVSKADSNLRDVYLPDAQGYWSPVFSFEPTVQYRATPTMAVALGLSLLVESPRSFGDIPTTAPDGDRRLGPSGLTTRAYELASGTQVFIGPYVGLMFGP